MIQKIDGERYIFWCNGCGRQAGGEYITLPKTLPLGWEEDETYRHYCPECKGRRKEEKESPAQNETRLEGNEQGDKGQSRWKKSSEMVPGKKEGWVIGRTKEGKVGIVRWSRSLEAWIGDDNKEIKGGEITHWHPIPPFP